MPPEALDLAHDGIGRDAEEARHLSVGGARQDTVIDGLEELGLLQPVGDGEGLRTKVFLAASTTVPLDPLRVDLSCIEAGFLELPTCWIQMEFTRRVRTEGRCGSVVGRSHTESYSKAYARNILRDTT